MKEFFKCWAFRIIAFVFALNTLIFAQRTAGSVGTEHTRPLLPVTVTTLVIGRIISYSPLLETKADKQEHLIEFGKSLRLSEEGPGWQAAGSLVLPGQGAHILGAASPACRPPP